MSLFLTYEKAKDILFQLEERLFETKDVFLDFPKNKFGFVTDKVRFSQEYRIATRNYNNAYKALNEFREAFCREFKTEIKAERDIK